MEYWILIVTILLGLLTFYRNKRRQSFFKEYGIPYLNPLPIVGNMGSIIFRRMSFIEYTQKIYQLDDNAKYVGAYDFSCPVVMIRDPELIKSITIKNFDHFVNHRGFVDPVQDPLFGKNLFSLRDNNWREIRNLLSPAFTSSKMKGMFKLMSKCAEDFADFLTDQAKTSPKSLDTKDIFTRYTSDVVATCAFGVTVDSMRHPQNEFYVLGREGTTFEGFQALKFFGIRNFPMLCRLFRIKLIGSHIEKFFYNLVRETIEMRDQTGTSRPDMIQLMMETRGNVEGKGPVLTIEDMTAQAFIFFFGGFDTTSSLMCFVAHEVAANPEVQSRLHEEIDEVYEKSGGDPSYEQVNSMHYLDAVINETLRLHSIAAFLDRICNKSFDLPPTLPGTKPLRLKPGDNVWLPSWAMQRDPKYFPNPDKFDPERFINDKSLANSPTYVPFGVGPRMCIGNRFALLETKVLFVHLLAKCKLNLSKKMIVPLQYTTDTFAVLAKGGFWLDLEPRNKWTSRSQSESTTVK